MAEETERPDDSLRNPSYRKRRRRMRTIDEKRRMIEETRVKGASVAEVARRHGVNANLLFKWRKLYERGALNRGRAPAGAQLLPVVLSQTSSQPGTETESAMAATGAALEIVLPCGVTVRIQGRADLALLPEVLSVLDAR